eukprot:g40324.t1
MGISRVPVTSHSVAMGAWDITQLPGLEALSYKNQLDRAGTFSTGAVLVTHDDTVKISDFGTSKELSDKSTKMSFAGTVAWMAPEVIRNEPVSEKVDI